MSKSHIGIKQTEKSKQKIREANIGKKHLKEQNQQHSKRMKGINNPMFGVHRFGELNPNWQNGISFEEYGVEFNKELKQLIKDRDFNTCQTPECMNTDYLDVHHIDYNKQNNKPENFITLCKSCHMKTNGKNRQYWVEFYQNIMINRIMECLL